MIRSKELGYSSSDISVEKNASPKDVADALSDALSSLLRKDSAEMTLKVVPGTYDIAIAKTVELAKLVRSAYDPPSDKYDLRKIQELAGFGAVVKTSLAMQAMLQEYKIRTSTENYLADEVVEEVPDDQ